MPSVIQSFNNVIRVIPNMLVYIIATLPPFWLFYNAISGNLGPEPVEVLQHKTGIWALQLLIFGLAITPLRYFTELNLLKMRRAVGVIAFFYIALHLAIWMFLDLNSPDQAIEKIIKHRFLLVGIIAFILLIPLALTSNNISVRLLGVRTWRRVHKLVYIAAILASFHFVIQSKGFQLEPILYLASTVFLVGLRIIFVMKLKRNRNFF